MKHLFFFFHRSLILALVFQLSLPAAIAQKHPDHSKSDIRILRTGGTSEGSKKGENGEKSKSVDEVFQSDQEAEKEKKVPEPGDIVHPISPEERCIHALSRSQPMQDLACMKYLPMNHRSVPMSLVFHAMRALDAFDRNRAFQGSVDRNQQIQLWQSARRNIHTATQILNGYPRGGMPQSVRLILNKALQEMPDFGPDRNRWSELFFGKRAELAPFLITRLFLNEAYMMMRFRPNMSYRGDIGPGSRGGVGDFSAKLGHVGAIPALIYRYFFPTDEVAPEGQLATADNELESAGRRGSILLPPPEVAGSYATDNFVINDKLMSVSQTALATELDERARLYQILMRAGLSEKVASATAATLNWGFNTLIPTITADPKSTNPPPLDPPGTSFPNPGGPSEPHPLDPMLDPNLSAADALARTLRTLPPPVLEQILASNARRKAARLAEVQRTSVGQAELYSPEVDTGDIWDPRRGGRTSTAPLYTYNRYLEWTLLMQAVVDPDSIKYDLQLQEFLKHVVLRYPVLRIPNPGSNARKALDAEVKATFQAFHPYATVKHIKSSNPDPVRSTVNDPRDDVIRTDFAVPDERSGKALDYSPFGSSARDTRESDLEPKHEVSDVGAVATHLYLQRRLRATTLTEVNGLSLVSREEKTVYGSHIVYELVSYGDRNWVGRIHTWRAIVGFLQNFDLVMKGIRLIKNPTMETGRQVRNLMVVAASAIYESRRAALDARVSSASRGGLVSTSGNAEMTRPQKLADAALNGLARVIDALGPKEAQSPYLKRLRDFVRAMETAAKVGGVYTSVPIPNSTESTKVIRRIGPVEASYRNALWLLFAVQVAKTTVIWNESQSMMYSQVQRSDASLRALSEILHGFAYGLNTADLARLKTLFPGRTKAVVPRWKIPVGTAAFVLDIASAIADQWDFDLPNTGDLFLKTLRGGRDLWHRSFSNGEIPYEDFDISKVEEHLGLGSGPEGCEQLGLRASTTSGRSQLLNIQRPCQLLKEYRAGLDHVIAGVKAIESGAKVAPGKSEIAARFHRNEENLRSGIENLSLAMLRTMYVVQLRRFNHPSTGLSWSSDYYRWLSDALSEVVRKIQSQKSYLNLQAILGRYAAETQPKVQVPIPSAADLEKACDPQKDRECEKK